MLPRRLRSPAWLARGNALFDGRSQRRSARRDDKIDLLVAKIISPGTDQWRVDAVGFA
jgi:hypothetical protein